MEAEHGTSRYVEEIACLCLLVQYISEFGTNHVYSADTFNENPPQSR